MSIDAWSNLLFNIFDLGAHQVPLLKCLLNGIVPYSRCSLVQIQPISQKFNSCVTYRQTDGRTHGPTDRRTDIPSYRELKTR